MPELAEVEITRRKLLPLARGRRILDFWTDWPRGLRIAKSKEQMAKSICGREILDVTRRGKVIFFKLSGKPSRMLAIHLGMSGRLAVTSQHTAERHPNPESRCKRDEGEGSPGILRRLRRLRMTGNLLSHWIHFRWLLSGGRELQFIDPRKFGWVWCGSPEDLERDPHIGRLGVDAKSIDFQRFSQILGDHRGMVKPFLLRQDNFAGIGNIIADESLWQAKIHPRVNIAQLKNPQIIALYRAIQNTIAAMLSSGGTTLRNWGHPDGKIGGYQERRLIYGKAGEPCPRCNKKLVRLTVGGRGTTVCPRCQKL